ncbi:MAG: IclR family transcriptional regulator [Microbacteriaceae bacterium]
MARTSAAVPGAQVVGRIGALLRVLSEHGRDGAGTTVVANAAGLTRSTAHRLLSSLAAEGFVDRDAASGHWLLGPELYLLGSVAAERYDIADLARDAVRELAAATGESAFLSARRGDETVCLVREEGSFPIRSFVLYEGVRFPLGVASAGLAILAFLPPAEIDAYLARVRLEETFGAPHREAAVRERITQTTRDGYAVNPGLLVEGSWGMGAAVFDRSGSPAWALSLTGIETRFREDRRRELGRLLLDAAHAVTQRLRAIAP